MTAQSRTPQAAISAVAVLVLLAGFVSGSSTALAAPIGTVDGECVGDANPQLERAPALTSKPDLGKGGKAIVVAPAGNDVAVLFVHGWVSMSGHANSRDGAFSKLIGAGRDRVPSGGLHRLTSNCRAWLRHERCFLGHPRADPRRARTRHTKRGHHSDDTGGRVWRAAYAHPARKAASVVGLCAIRDPLLMAGACAARASSLAAGRAPIALAAPRKGNR
jgi:hypothetical protein